MKAILTGHIGEEKAHLIIEITDPELIAQAIEKKELALYTQKEFDDLRKRLLAVERQIDRLTTGNVGHVRGTIKTIISGIK